MTFKSLLQDNTQFVFLSPHQDDVALSCSALLTTLARKKKKIIIINFFTKAHSGPYTLSAKKFLQVSGGHTNAISLYLERNREDIRALSYYPAKIINLDLTDALFRKKRHLNNLLRIVPEFSHVYPTYNFHIKKRIAENDPALHDAKTKLKKILPKNALVIAPFNIANHVDHNITRLTAETLSNNVMYYADFPYSLYTQEPKLDKSLHKVTLPVNLSQKNKVIREYKSQFMGLFPKGEIPEHEESYFISTSV